MKTKLLKSLYQHGLTTSRTTQNFTSKSSLQIIQSSFFEIHFRHDRDEEALEILEQACLNDPKNLQAYQNLQNVKNKTSRWHFCMLNDTKRNSAFMKAIHHWVDKNKNIEVLDIGCGTGLMSIYAEEAMYVGKIYAVESNETMAGICRKVLEENSSENAIKLILKHSKDLIIGEDLPKKVDLVISETLDSGVFGEGILDSMIHAKQELLKSDGKIVPWKVKIHVAGYKSKSLTMNQILVNDSFQEYLFLHNYRLVAKKDEPYDAEYVDKIPDFELVTGSVVTLEVDFNDVDSMQGHFDGSIVKEFELTSSVSNDYLDGFVTWFTLYLNEDDPENNITTAPKSGSCWNQPLFKLKQRVLIDQSQVLKLKMSCELGILKIHHSLDVKPDKIDLEIDPDVLRYLNDEEYLGELEFEVGKCKEKFKSCLDLSPFPYIGLTLLKDGRLDKLWCSKRESELIKKIAAKNVIDEKKIEFMEENDNELLPEAEKFQLIILHPFHPLGDLDKQIICEYSKYKEHLDKKGVLIPFQINLFGELIHSEWLVNSCRATNRELFGLGIDDFMNKFATEVHLDLDSFFKCEKLSSAFKISKIFFDDELHQKKISVPMKNINLPAHAIWYHHQIQLTKNSQTFSTNRRSKSSCFRRAAQVFPEDISISAAKADVSFIQHSGIVKCDVVS